MYVVEIASLVASTLAVVWARKLDLQKALADPKGRGRIVARIRRPVDRYSERMKELDTQLERFMQHGPRMGFFCLMVSLVYSAGAFLFSLAANAGIKNVALNAAFPLWQARLLFFLIVFFVVLVYYIARVNASPENKKYSKWEWRCWKAYDLIGAMTLTGISYLVYRSYSLTIIAAVISVPAAALASPKQGDAELFRLNPIGVIANSALAALGLLLVLLFFLSNEDSTTLEKLIVGLSIGSSLSCAFAFAACEFDSLGEIRNRPWTRRFRFLGELGLVLN